MLSLPKVPQEPFTLEIVTRCDPSANTELSGLYMSGGMFCTQCEAEGFRRITYFYDRPDVMARFTVRIEAEREQCPILLSNGNPRGAGAVAGTSRHFARVGGSLPQALLSLRAGGRRPGRRA